MTIQTESLNKESFLEKPISTAINLNWEMVAYISIFIMAVITRFYNLGLRVMSHDESLHTLYSWNLYAGKGYSHDPLMHGPFLFHANAFMYFLFGDNDFTARISTAVAGIILVMLPYWFRPWLGRVGALSASFMILISPGLMYYSRYIRHDIFISVWTVMMFLGFFQFMRSRQSRWLYVAAAGVALMLSTKEVAYIHGFIGFTFILLTLAWESLSVARRRILEYGLLSLILLFGAFIAFLLMQEPVTAESEGGFAWLVDHVDMFIAAMIMLIAALFTKFSSDPVNRPITSFVTHIPERLVDLGKAVLLALVIFSLLHTTFFSNINGLYSGTLGEIKYWLDQHDVQRGGQPWFYYLLMTPLYEFLPLTIGFVGAFVYLIWRKGFVAHADTEYLEEQARLKSLRGDDIEAKQQIWPSDGGTFAGCILYWTIGAFTIYSWAGEKMPWLTVHITLPFILLAAHIINTTLKNFDWQTAYKKGGFIAGFAMLLLGPAFVALFTSDPFQSQSLQSIAETSKFIAAGVVIVVIVWLLLWHFGQQLGYKRLAQVAFVTYLFAMSLLTIRFAWMLNFINYDYVSEPLVYAHGAPDVKQVLDQIDEISRRTVGDKMIKVAYDNDSTWPLEWYMREYPNRVFYGENPNRDALDSPIVIVGAANESKVKPYLGDMYTRYNYRMVWWPIEDYKNLTMDSIINDYLTGPDSAKNRKSLANIIFYRHYENYNLNEWPFVHRFNLYIRNDTLNDIWDYQSGPIAPGTGLITLDPYEGKRTELAAIEKWGNGGGSAEAQFNKPRNLAVAPDGTVYVADSGNHRIQAFDSQGNYLFQWGNGKGNAPGQMDEPWGIGVGLDGRVYVADTWNHRVQIFSAEGKYMDTFGSYVNAQADVNQQPGGFFGPRDVAVDAEGNILISDTGNKRIQKFTPDGEFISMWGGGGIVAGRFEEQVGLDIDSEGNIFVADTWNERMQKFDPLYNPVLDWRVVGWGSEHIFNKPYLAVDDQNRVFVSDPEGYRIIVYDGNSGEVIKTWGQYGQELNAFGWPNGLTFDHDGYLLVVDADNNRVLKFDIPF